MLLVEDDADLRFGLTRGLGEAEFDVTASATGLDFMARAVTGEADVFIIDIGLPDADGRDLCQALRADGDQTPAIFLTARDALPDRIAGFDSGGDDYLVKPFAMAELVVRLRALIRRGAPGRVPRYGQPQLDPARHAVLCGDAQVDLTPTEFRLLAALIARRGEVLRRSALVQVGWSHGALVSDNALDSLLRRIRRKLDTLPNAPQIETVRGVGYTVR